MAGTERLLHQISHKILLYRPTLQLFQNFVASLLLGRRIVLPHIGEEYGNFYEIIIPLLPPLRLSIHHHGDHVQEFCHPEQKG